MAISAAKVLEGDPALSEFTTDPVTLAPLPPVQPMAQATPAQRVRTGPAVTAKRRVRVDWHLLGVILLILTSAAVCIYRLAWAMQP